MVRQQFEGVVTFQQKGVEFVAEDRFEQLKGSDNIFIRVMDGKVEIAVPTLEAATVISIT